MSFDFGLSKKCISCLVKEYSKYMQSRDGVSGGGVASSLATSRKVIEDRNKNSSNDSVSDDSILSGKVGTKPMPSLATGPGLDTISDEQRGKENERGSTTMKQQSGFTNNSIVVCPEVYMYNDSLLQDKISNMYTEQLGPFAYGKIVQVPNAR